MKERDNRVRRYIILFLKRLLLIVLLMPVAIFAAFGLLSVFDESVRGRVPEVALSGTCIVLLPVLLGFLRIYRFRRMIEKQEEYLSVNFEDTGVKGFEQELMLFLADDWLILAGSMAFHRMYISMLNWEMEYPRRAATGYWLKIKTVDQKTYRIHLHSVQACKQVHRWWNRKRENDTLEVLSNLWDIGVF